MTRAVAIDVRAGSLEGTGAERFSRLEKHLSHGPGESQGAY